MVVGRISGAVYLAYNSANDLFSFDYRPWLFPGDAARDRCGSRGRRDHDCQPRTQHSKRCADWSALGVGPYHHDISGWVAHYFVRDRDSATARPNHELSVGLMLILLGVLNLSGMMKWITENFGGGANHTHAHGEIAHSHAPQDSAGSLGWMDRTFGRLGLYQLLRPLGVGIVHGLAGSAAVALLVLTTIRVPIWAIVYLLVFGLGTVAGMMLITAAIAVPFTVSQSRFTRLNSVLATASGVISLVFGLLIVYEMGFKNGLFARHPTWTPH